MGEQCDQSSQAKESDESFFEWEGGENNYSIGENKPPTTHMPMARFVSDDQYSTDGQPIRDHYRLEQQPISKKVEASRWQEYLFSNARSFYL